MDRKHFIMQIALIMKISRVKDVNEPSKIKNKRHDEFA